MPLIYWKASFGAECKIKICGGFMNKRQAKKARKKVTYPLVDEMNLLTLSAEEYKAAMTDFHQFVQKYCRYKHYRDRYKKIRFNCYHFPVGEAYRNKILSALQSAKKMNVQVVIQDKDMLENMTKYYNTTN